MVELIWEGKYDKDGGHIALADDAQCKGGLKCINPEQ